MQEIEVAADEMSANADSLPHDRRKELADNWDAEYEALCSITMNYLNLGEDDEKIVKEARQAAINTYTQAMVYSLAAGRLRKGLYEPTKVVM